ncbi:MAG: hydrogenase subunit MbhD domain-containing protein [Burkholderiaceae bacterium]
MSTLAVFEWVLAALIIGGALYTVLVRETYAAVVGFVAYGLLVALAWVLLRAVDVAMTEAAIGTGLTGIALLGAAAQLRGGDAAAVRAGPGVRVLAALLAIGVGGGLAAAVLALGDPAPTLAPQAVAALPATGLGNPVTGVLMVFRGTDTLLEKVVLVLAVLGVWSLAPEGQWGGRPGLRHRADPAGVLVFLGRRLPPFGVLVAVYILWVSADLPGGAFPAASILAAMWLLTMMAGLTDAPPISRPWVRAVVVAGAAVFLAVGLAGLGFGDAFLSYPVAIAKPVIVVIEVVMTITVAVTLGMLVVGAPERKG